jgi:hypothetical protein
MSLCGGVDYISSENSMRSTPSLFTPKVIPRLSYTTIPSGEDGRLDRLLEIATMVMEALSDEGTGDGSGSGGGSGGAQAEMEWAIVGHSGDDAKLPLVDFGKPPRTRKARGGCICSVDIYD